MFWDVFAKFGNNIYFLASWAKFPSSIADFSLKVFLYFSPQNHKISLEGVSLLLDFFPAVVIALILVVFTGCSPKLGNFGIMIKINVSVQSGPGKF